MSDRDTILIAVGLPGRPRHDSIDACGSLNIEYQKAPTIRAWPIFVTWGEPSVEVRENNLKWGRTPLAERARGRSRRGRTARQT